MTGFIKKPGRQASMMEQFILGPVALRHIGGRKDKIIIHHITENTPYRLQLEVEASYGDKVSFHRLIID